MEPLTAEQRRIAAGTRDRLSRSASEALFEWKDLPDGVAYLKMPTWALYNSKWDWKTWLHEHLDASADGRGLVVDLRGNEGGVDAGKEIIAHLIDKPLSTSSMSRLVRYRKVPDDLVKYLDTWDKSFFDWGSAAAEIKTPLPTAPDEVPYLRLKREGDGVDRDVIQPRLKRFRGNVLVLIDATNSSATFQFAQVMQRNRLATLVGQPTGGSQRGINGGAFFFLRLPKSGIEMDLPLIGTFPDSPMPDSGLTPDISVLPSASDVAKGKDVVLDRALRMIR